MPHRQPEGVLVLCFFIFGILTHRTGVFIAVKGVRRLSRCGGSALLAFLQGGDHDAPPEEHEPELSPGRGRPGSSLLP